MAKCEVEPKLDYDKFKEACERFKKICEREMGEAFLNIDTEYPVVLKNTRDCETCVHARPFGGENDNRCSVWECDYINRDKAIEAYRTEVATKNDELIILRPTTFMKAEVFDITKEVWEKEIPNSIVIPYTMDVINRTREWIPTSLCLPQRDRPVLVAVKIWPDEHGYHYTTSIDVYDHNGWMDNGKNVVAWQPLPAPYKGE